MRRLVLTPRWLGIHAAVTAVVVAFVALGFWQLDRARAEATPAPSRAEQSAVALTALSAPGGRLPADAVGRLATATGRYDVGGQFLVPNRQPAAWVVTFLRLPDGAAIPVVRGSTGDRSIPVPSGAVTVTGWLQPSETGTLADGSINTAELIQDVPYDLYDGYLVLVDQTPPPADALQPVEASRTSADKPGFPLQNAAYALQWWLFAAFVVFIWWRTVRDAIRPRPAPAPAPQRAVPPQKRPIDK